MRNNVQPSASARIQTTDDEQAAAQRSVDRAFPAVAAFLASTDAPQVTPPSVDHLMDAPLQQLVDELGITLDESSIDEPGFTGYAYVTRNRVVVSLPPNRSELEHDCMARYLIGTAFKVDGLPPLPEPFRVVDITADVQREQAPAAGCADHEGRGSW
ncbi:hypothetical protein [Streptomyces fructofermentans]|uniref:Uncharacterized protein n=1 Tax=Streptomyces fructofermentans TaxID=152141 RepID=A0A918K874_9ACTN|nr:hypothetical protein [Streptomyces fructofermentans]GGX54203.1 hypothetical protein GCM10010515_21780 [Streptomyces fructofermentans]